MQPPVRPPVQWPHRTNKVVNSKINLPELAWWEQFDDVQLNQLIEQALQDNNSLKISVANVEYAQAELKKIQLNWIPGMSILGGYSEMPTLGDPKNFIGVIPMYTMNIFQQIKEQERAEYTLTGTQFEKDSVRLALIGQVSGSYFAVLAQTQALILYQQLLANNQKLLKLYQSQYHADLIAYDDIDLLQSNISQIQAQMAITEHNIVVAKNALHYLLNQNPGDLDLSKSFTQIDSNKIIPGNLPATVLNNRPDIKQAQNVLKASNANIGVAASGLLPSIRLDAFLNYRSSLNAYQHLTEATSDIPVLSPTTFGKIDASKAEYKSAYIQYIDMMKAALRDVDNDLSAYSAYSRQLSQFESAFNQEKKRCRLVNSRFKHALESQVGVALCEIRLDQLALQLNQEKFDKMMTIVVLYQDLGGGYIHDKSRH
jgi:outer membrane protein TolC